MPSRSSRSDERVLVGRVLRPHGVRGDVRVESHSDVEGRFSAGSTLWVVGADGSARRRRIERSRSDRGAWLLRFEDLDDREAAADLRGARLEVDEADVPEAPDGFYYHHDLVGCVCVERGGSEGERTLGQVVRLHEDGGGWILEVRRSGQTLLVPFVDAFLRTVDIAAQRIEVELPPGLVDTCTSRS
ncbi:MAG: ribosome maturation factor RimM [Acidobacteriota bacterium]